ncbi:MAG: hypothetical protein KAS64_10510 [Spirochaetes bacterium]|nr:hypothetical protein [Spirochaetota bacterium]
MSSFQTCHGSKYEKVISFYQNDRKVPLMTNKYSTIELDRIPEIILNSIPSGLIIL